MNFSISIVVSGTPKSSGLATCVVDFSSILIVSSFFDKFLNGLLIKYSSSGPQDISANKSTNPSKHMDIPSSSRIMKPDFVQPPLAQYPGGRNWIYYSCHQDCINDVGVHICSFRKRTRNYGSTSWAKRILVEPIQILRICEIHVQKLLWPYDSAVCFCRKSIATDIKCNWGNTNVKKVFTYNVHLVSFSHLTSF